ncbi:hypothetical protein NZD89_20325 [Alicyclobacillus fastidiosus]|uniref:Uncharacterized protein n=1 Tax=Alicyclobacillus fastidiosus TaxID=392011 RepID=A0ABY6ZCQ6_9BACL|nr:hypothetical protein [Alicyclobacillus fastidiosus]WAH40636.1 hypothetical protein NZD89_20325 [Alicyclobacillus fastidiosus]GMA62082.1 hypothetical protein GCM10025859_25220 [Alicyclobacillus fastidiosus]
MKIDTLIKFGSLAFNVAQDEKFRELLKIAHNGAKRRGFYDRPIVPQYDPRLQTGNPYWPRRHS